MDNLTKDNFKLYLYAVTSSLRFMIHHAIPSGKNLAGNGLKHTVSVVKAYLGRKTYPVALLVMDWPPHNPDLSIIKAVWYHLNRELNKRQQTSKQEL